MAVSFQTNPTLLTLALRDLRSRAFISRPLISRWFVHSLRKTVIALPLLFPSFAAAQIDTTSIAPHRYLVLYRNAAIPGDAESRIASAGARLTRRNEHIGIAAVESAASEDDAATLRRLAAQPNVDYVFHDRIVSAHSLRLRAVTPASVSPVSVGVDGTGQAAGSIGRLPTHGPILTAPTPPLPPPPPPPPPYDTYYTTPQSWAVQQVGGYGNNVPGGPAHGPWDTTMGKGVRIAIIDSGVDQSHPDIAPNLALNLTEVDQSVSVPEHPLQVPCGARGLSLGLWLVFALAPKHLTRRRGRGNVGIPKGFPKSVGRVESRPYGFPCFPYSVYWNGPPLVLQQDYLGG
jgi:hypothetical protein